MRSRLHNRDVIKLTGPGAFTEGVVDYLRRDTQLGPTFRLEDLAGVDVPLRVGSVLFLPSRFWTPGQRHSRSGAINGPDACVRHLCVLSLPFSRTSSKMHAQLRR